MTHGIKWRLATPFAGDCFCRSPSWVTTHRDHLLFVFCMILYSFYHGIYHHFSPFGEYICHVFVSKLSENSKSTPPKKNKEWPYWSSTFWMSRCNFLLVLKENSPSSPVKFSGLQHIQPTQPPGRRRTDFGRLWFGWWHFWHFHLGDFRWRILSRKMTWNLKEKMGLKLDTRGWNLTHPWRRVGGTLPGMMAWFFVW